MARSPLRRFAVMRAMDEETPGAHRLQPFQRARHPVDIRQRFALDRFCQREPGRMSFALPRPHRRFAVGIERHFVDVTILVDLDHGDRRPLVFEGGAERRENTLGLDLAGGEVEPLWVMRLFLLSLPAAQPLQLGDGRVRAFAIGDGPGELTPGVQQQHRGGVVHRVVAVAGVDLLSSRC